jgi:hypothetical protein
LEKDAMMLGIAPLTWSERDAGTTWQIPAVSSAALIDLAAERKWQAAKNQILLYGRFGENWDGYDSPAPYASVLSRALDFLGCVRARNMVPPARIALSPDGFIAIEWTHAGVCQQAEIGLSSEVSWVEFGKQGKPSQWSEYLPTVSSVRDGDWTRSQEIEDGVAASASAL